MRSREKSDQVRGTHQLKTASGGTGRDGERKRLREGHSPPRDSTGRDKSEDRKESNRARGTHHLKVALGGTSQGKKATELRALTF